MPSLPRPCSCLVLTTPTARLPLNAIPTSTENDRAERRTLQLRQCARMAELGMALVEATHREALRECQPPPPHRGPPVPNYTTLPDDTPFRSTTFNDLFIQLTHCVRQSILLEARLEAGACDRPLPTAVPAPRPPRDEPEPSTSPTPDHLEGHPRLAYERLDDDLAGDTRRTPPEILAGIAKKLAEAAESGLASAASPIPESQAARAAKLYNTPPPKPPPLAAAQRPVRPANRSPP